MEKGSLDSTPVYYQNAAWNNVLPNYTSTGTPAKRTYRDIDLKLSTSDFEGHGLTLTWDVNDSLTLKSLTGYRELDWSAYQDNAEAFAFINTYITSPVGSPLVAASGNTVSTHQFSQEFQFSGSAFDNSLEYVGGLYFFKESGSTYLQFNSAIPIISIATVKDRYVNADAKSQAIYAQATWTPPILDEKFSITGGARYTKDNRSAERRLIVDGTVLENGSTPTAAAPNGAENDQAFKRFNPSLTLSYNWTDDVSSYLKWTTGYKAGGSSESAPVGSFDKTFGPEKVTSYELGLKSYLFDRQVRMNVALFESKFEDMQLDLSVDPLDASTVQGLNAGKATVQGAEIEMLYSPIEDLSFTVNYTYLHTSVDEMEAIAGTTFDPAVNPASPYTVGQNIKEIFALPYSPKHSVDTSIDWTFMHFETSRLSAHLDYRFQSSIYDTSQTGSAVPNHDYFAIPSYGILNAQLAWSFDLPRGDHAKISLWGKNIANKKYRQFSIGMGSGIDTQSPVSFTPAGYTSSAIAWSEPPSYGVNLSYEY
jgi:iron complex outermembrane receptor protein